MLPTTSFKYTFQNILADNIIRDAFTQINVNSALISCDQYTNALQSLNIILNSWISKKGINLFTVEQDILGLTQGQSSYFLPLNTSRILEALLVQTAPIMFPANTVFMNTNAVPAPPAPPQPYVLSNVFTNTVNTYNEALAPVAAASQIPGGFYGCYMPLGLTDYPEVRYVSITSFIKKTSAIAIDYMIQPSPIPVVAPATLAYDNNWQTALHAPVLEYFAGIPRYFALPVPLKVPFIRVREVNNNNLNLTSIQFLGQTGAQILKPVSRDTFSKTQVTTSNNQRGLGSSTYYINRGKQPVLNLYPAPSDAYNLFLYNRVRMIQDVGTEVNTLDISARFIEAITAALAFRLSRLYGDPTTVQIMSQLADGFFDQAASEDSEQLPLYIQFGGQ